MGKASRMKQFSRMVRESQKNAANGNSSEPAAKGPTLKAGEAGKKSEARSKHPQTLEDLLSMMGAGNVVVIDGSGVHGPEQVRKIYWADVCEGIRHRGVDCMSEMVALGRMMQQSILDVKIPVVDYKTGREIEENIVAAMFLLEKVDCFKFLLDVARREGCNWEEMGKMFRVVVAWEQNNTEETPRHVMAKAFARFMAEAHYKHNELEKAMNTPGTVMGQPFARRIAQDYLNEMQAKKEREELQAWAVQAESQASTSSVRI